MQTTIKAMTVLKGAGGYAFTFGDEFSAPVAAITATTRLALAGIGTWNTVNSSDKGVIDANGVLVITASGTFDPALAQNALQTKAAGLATCFRVQNRNAGTLAVGLMKGTAVASIGNDRRGNFAVSTSQITVGVDNGGDTGTSRIAVAVAFAPYDLWVVEQTLGMAYFAKGGPYSAPTLLWLDLVAHDTAAGERAAFIGPSGTATVSVDHVRQVLLTGKLSDGTFYTLDQANPVSNTDYTATNDVLAHWLITAPNPLATSAEFRICQIDANNYISAAFDNAGALTITETVAGSPTTLVASIASVIALSTTRRIVLQKIGRTLRVWTWITTAKTQRSTGVTVNAVFETTGVITKTILGAGWTSSRITCYPARSSDYNGLTALNTVSGDKGAYVTFDGDSLTFGTSLDGAAVAYPTQALALLGYSGSNVAVAGQTSADVLTDAITQVDALMDIKRTRQTVVIWIGANDLTTATSAATIESNIQTYGLGRKATGAKVVVCTITPRTGLTAPQETKRTDVNTWLLANYTAFADALVDLAADTRLDDASDLTYYDSGGTHMTNAGYAAVAALVAAAISALVWS